MKKDIEVEIRGVLNKSQYDKAQALFKKKALFRECKHRILIDYSTFLKGEGIRDRQKDIRVRVTNGIPEIIIKLGSWGGSESRRELSFKGKKGEFNTLVEIFGQLGFSKGMLAERDCIVYEYKGIEFVLAKTPGQHYYFEAEKMTHSKEDFAKVENEIRKVCKEFGLKVVNKEGFFKFIDELNKTDNQVFEFKDFKENYFGIAPG
jgi:adenylate cyclase class IV